MVTQKVLFSSMTWQPSDLVKKIYCHCLLLRFTMRNMTQISYLILSKYDMITSHHFLYTFLIVYLYMENWF